MRISPINARLYANQTNYSKNAVCPTEVNQPSFKHTSGSIGVIGGAFAGVCLTILSGGTLLWTVPVLGGVGGLGGELSHKGNSAPSSENYNLSGYEDISGFDWIG